MTIMTEIIDKIFVFWFLTLAIVLFAIIIASPTVIAFLINRWLTKKGIRHVGVFLLISAPIWTAYEAYTAVYPTDKFYFSEFKKVTLRDAPESAAIIRKKASYPDFHGEYCSASLMTVSTEDYLSLLNELKADSGITKNNPERVIGSSELFEVMGNFNTEQIIYGFTRSIIGQEDHHLYIGFLDDKKTIVISVCVT